MVSDRIFSACDFYLEPHILCAMFKIFEKLGGVDPTLDVIQRRRGLRPSARAVEEWRKRKAIPHLNIGFLMEECLARGIHFSEDDFKASPPPKARRRA